MLNAANREPRQFDDPDQLNLGRANNRHIAFGYVFIFVSVHRSLAWKAVSPSPS